MKIFTGNGFDDFYTVAQNVFNKYETFRRLGTRIVILAVHVGEFSIHVSNHDDLD